MVRRACCRGACAPCRPGAVTSHLKRRHACSCASWSDLRVFPADAPAEELPFGEEPELDLGFEPEPEPAAEPEAEPASEAPAAEPEPQVCAVG